MAQVFPFQAYRYTAEAGPLETLVTQPYDKISAEMRRKYLEANPHNLVRVILGESTPADHDTDNVYTRAADYLRDWIAGGILARDPEPSLFAYFQEFAVPDSGETAIRKGFIGLGAVEDYAQGVVHRHEQTLTGPKKDRLELLRKTRAHFGQIFMLYPDPAGEIDAILDETALAPPDAQVADDYGARHTVWRISDLDRIARIQALMADKKLLIADGHHRYETAVAFRDENPGSDAARRVMMTFVNMHSAGLKILAGHRLVSNLPSFDKDAFLSAAAAAFDIRPVASVAALGEMWGRLPEDEVLIGAQIGQDLYGLKAKDAAGRLNVTVLHESAIRDALGISDDAVRDQRYLGYVRGAESAAAEAREGRAQVAFLLKPVSVKQVADISFGGGVMPQKSTDFYPKLLSGLAIYRLDG
ncbi:MAG: DUF1015 domain-containing protein [Bryobacterales bacterium]|nr:DUF1015 domain-containing protein [Bryobacterales bacterium]